MCDTNTVLSLDQFRAEFFYRPTPPGSTISTNPSSATSEVAWEDRTMAESAYYLRLYKLGSKGTSVQDQGWYHDDIAQYVTGQNLHVSTMWDMFC